MGRSISLLIALVFASIIVNGQNSNADLARIYKAMNKGRNGEDLTIGVIGGSITQGYAASSESTRWSNLMADWWGQKFPLSTVNLVNAGWGGTGSDIGVHRVYDDLLVEEPDFIVIEFSVNDTEGDLATKMMEGLVQQILLAENSPGLMILMLKQDNGTTAQASHKLVGEHYKIPMVSFADLIDDQVEEDGVSLSSIFVDGLHPNDVGMDYIADFLKNQLDSIYSTLPNEENLPTISTELPEPLISDTFASTCQYFYNNIIPQSKVGWEVTSSGWSTEIAGSQIDFELVGNAVSLIFTQNNQSNRGKAEVWIDEGEKTIIDAYMTDDWGTKYSFSLINEDLSSGEHTLHIRALEESSTSGNFIHISRILVAGEVGSAPPIALTGKTDKTVVGREIELNATESFDPDGDVLDAFLWNIEESPDGSEAQINKATENLASFTPDVAGEYLISLKVSSGINTSVPAIKTVYVRETNNIPVAVTGNDTISDLNKYFRFDGTKSYDDDNDKLSYLWAVESKPEGSELSLMLETSVKPQCKFDVEGEYVFSLVVFDSIDYSEKQFIKVEGKEGYTGFNDKTNINNGFKVIPNPTANSLNVKFISNNANPIAIHVISLQGKIIAQKLVNQPNLGVNNININFGVLPAKPGVYILRLSQNNKMFTSKFSLI